MFTQSTPPDSRDVMRWVMMSVYLLALLGSLAGSIIVAYHTSNVLSFGVPTALLAAMRPIMRYLFGTDHSAQDPDHPVQ